MRETVVLITGFNPPSTSPSKKNERDRSRLRLSSWGAPHPLQSDSAEGRPARDYKHYHNNVTSAALAQPTWMTARKLSRRFAAATADKVIKKSKI